MNDEINLNDETLAAMNAFALGMFGELASRAEPILAAKVAATGAAHFKDLARDLAGKLLRESLLEAAAGHFVGLDMDAVRRAVDAFFDPQWLGAWGRVMRLLDTDRPAFDVAVGPDAAIVLAGIGLAVIPLDKKTMRPIGKEVRDWKEAAKVFGRLKTAFVGYDLTAAPFYALLTDSLNSMNESIRTDTRLSQAKSAVGRTPYEFKNTPDPFQHSTLLLPRDPSDRFETVVLEDPRSNRGSIMFLAGWRDGDIPTGAPNDGYFAIPLQVIHAILHNPAFFGWLNQPSGKPASVH